MNDKIPGDGMEEEDMDLGMDEEAFDDADMGEEGDFVEEDWEAYDEDQYIDDGEGDGGKAARVAAFNKIVIGGAVVVAMLVGGYTMFHVKDNGLGHPEMNEVSKPAPVAENQKVEFHSETKVAAKDAFGVRYGETVQKDEAAEAPARPAAGLMNNPGMLDQIRNQQEMVYEDEAQRPPSTTPQVVDDEQPPMPSPISSGGEDSGDQGDMASQSGAPGLIPMPGEADSRQPAPKSMASASESGERLMMDNSDTPRSPGQEEGSPMLSDGEQDSAAMEDMMKRNGPESRQSASADLQDLSSKLDSMQKSLAKLDDLQDAMDKLEERIDKMEKSGATVRRQASSPSSAPAPRKAANIMTHTASAAHSSARPSNSWVLKSAQPGKAMVSPKGQNDMMTVTVGDTLSGLGRITAIYVQDGQWIVQGTGGRITQ